MQFWGQKHVGTILIHRDEHPEKASYSWTFTMDIHGSRAKQSPISPVLSTSPIGDKGVVMV
jgi:hypothetical protein